MLLVAFLALAGLSQAAPLPQTRNNRTTLATRSSGYKNVVYYGTWDIYSDGRNFQPEQIPINDVTHAVFAFAQVNPDSGEIFLGEHDNQKNVADRLYALKQQNRNLKVLLSIGGYTASESGQFDTFILDPAKRAFSARTAVNLMASLGMDGLDWDYEYPKTPDQSSGLVDLLRLSRQELDAHAAASAPGYDFELTIASPAGWNEYSRLPMKAMDQYLSFWNLMAYDFAGASWSTTVQYHSNLYPASAALTATSVSGIVDAYIGLSIPADKIVLGLPLYGRTFQGSFGPGTAHSSARPLMPDQFEAGSYDLKVLPRPGTKEQFDQQAGSAWCYNPSTGETVTYDNAQSVAMKAQFIRDRGLGGAMWWEASGDRTGGDSLIGKMAAGLGLEQKTNTLARV